jgi:hypothetical protein
VEIYELTSIGRGLAHSTRSPDTPEWKVIYFLSKQGRATKDQIQSYVPLATSATLAKLRIKHVIQGGN